MSKIIKKADVYLKGETTEIRVSVNLESDNFKENFSKIEDICFLYAIGHDLKLISIYFREEEESHD